jgi:cell division protein FtsN
MNDSLLVQSYIEAYDISYPEALRRIENEVAELKQHLESKGQYELNDIGILSLKEDGRLVFEPCEAGILTPSLYGLSSFEMQPVAEVEQKQPVTPVITVVTPESDSTTKKVEEPLITVLDVEADETKKKENDPDTIVIKMSWVRNAVAVVAAAIVFFLIQTPVSNSNVINDVPQQSAVLHINKQQPVAYAEPKAEEPVVEAVETEEPAIEEEKKDEPAVEVKEEPAPIIEVVKEPVAEKKAEPKKVAEKKAEPKPVAEKKAEPKPVAEKKAEPKAVAEKKAEPKPVVEKKAEPNKEVKNYCIVLASQTARSLAEDFVAQIKKKGYTSARIVKMNNSEKVRVIYGSYQTESEVYNELNKMRKLDIFKDAWVLRP